MEGVLGGLVLWEDGDRIILNIISIKYQYFILTNFKIVSKVKMMTNCSDHIKAPNR